MLKLEQETLTDCDDEAGSGPCLGVEVIGLMQPMLLLYTKGVFHLETGIFSDKGNNVQNLLFPVGILMIYSSFFLVFLQ